MKKLLSYLLPGFCLSLVSINAFAGSEQIDIGVTIFQEDENDRESPSKGHRIPSTPIICTIDFENHHIASSIPDEIIAYELWDEDGTAPIVSCATDHDLIEYMANASGVFQLRLVTSERTYVGYLDL